MIEHLFAFGSGLLRDPVTNLSRGRENASAVANLREATQPSDRRGCGERLEISMIHICCEAGRS